MERRYNLKPIILITTLLVATNTFAQPSPGAGNTPSADLDNFTIENSLHLRDPFSRFVPKTENFDEEVIPELERYELDKFKLAGVITGPKKNKALITDPSGRMHVVSIGTPIGNRRGMIKNIGAGYIVVEEKVVNLLGQEEKIETEIGFKKKQ